MQLQTFPQISPTVMLHGKHCGLVPSPSHPSWHFHIYRYWWKKRIFPFTKNHTFIPRSRRYFYLSHLRILVSLWLLTWLVITRELPAQARRRFFSNFTLKMAFLRYAFAVIEFSSSSLLIWLSGTENLCIIVLILRYNFISEFHNIFVTGILG